MKPQPPVLLPLHDTCVAQHLHLSSKLITQSAPSEMTTRHTSLAAAIVVAPQLGGVALDAVHLIAQITLPMDL